MAAFKKTLTDVNSEPNVVPMADIMLVLLIIFMVITPMLQKDISVELVRTNNPRDMRDADRLVHFPFAQRAGHQRRKCAGLFPRGRIGQIAVNHHTDGPRRHQEQQHHHGLGGKSHLPPHRQQVESDGPSLLQQHHSIHINVCHVPLFSFAGANAPLS